ncbi:DUF6232 family protein [Chryseolinea lacunae]|uniref:Uncharacterized protein n=1 Tax=Chryseolinea lacunae TaxID=2801331 RepID=A0ABS1KUB1_9BACT|nr:DUF6232 family protein [Chryseolinea lacunae]MBL0742954.1 hypothetical protein [Chryseolinea lacunae]
MIPDKVLYTDGRGITVTDSTFQVKNMSYRLNGITKHGLSTLAPERLPGILLVGMGILIGLFGLLKLIPSTMIEDVQINGTFYTANYLALWIGAGLLLFGLIVMAIVRERYAVRIATAEGEKNAVVSNKKEYIAQIVNALNEAFHREHVHTVYTSNTVDVR